MNSQLTEQDQQRFNKQLQDPTDEIGVRSDEEEDDEESDADEYVHLNILLYLIDKNPLTSSDDETDEDDDGMGQPPVRGNQMGTLPFPPFFRHF